jgi:hypothetical protein
MKKVWENSNGTRREVVEALHLGIPVFDSLTELIKGVN